jgi:hypothetical protein
MINRQLAIIAIVALFASPAHGDDKARPARRTFEITLDGVIDTESMNKKDRMKNDTRLRYAYERSGTETVLSLEEIELKTVINEKPTLEAFMNRSRFHVNQNGSEKDFTADSADEKLKTMLRDSFGPPLVKFAFDDAGNEIKRTQVAGPGAQGILNKELIANVRCFHTAFHADKMKWDSPVEMGGGTGGTTVAGILTYERLAAKKSDRGIAFKVTGDMQPDVQRTAVGQLITRRSVTGQQIYSPELNDWISGEWAIKMTTELDNGKKEAGGRGTGMVIAKMKMIANR